MKKLKTTAWVIVVDVMEFNAEQIELCRQLSELLPKREPQVGEVWWLEESSPNADGVVPRNGLFSKFPTKRLLHPLYTEGELLEMIKGKVDHDHPCDDGKPCPCAFCIGDRIIDAIYADNILSALLRLAIEVTTERSQ